MKKQDLLEALYRLQDEFIRAVKEENPDEEYPEDIDDRIGELQNTIEILLDIRAEEI